MNNATSAPDNSEKKNFCPYMMRFGNHHLPRWTVYLSLGILTAGLIGLFSNLGTYYRTMALRQTAAFPPTPESRQATEPIIGGEKHRATDSLINRLKYYGLWQIESAGKIPRFFIKNYPPDLHALDNIAIKKRVFLHALLPHALFVRQEALRKRQRLESILSKIECAPENIKFTPDHEGTGQCAWSAYLAEDEVAFIEKLCRNYRTKTASGLLERVDAVPTSIILAQGALESSWGSSRFTREGNNIFGMWTWKTKGMVPNQREKGKTHRVKYYENVLDSVRAYHLTLNRLAPYQQFRQLRSQTDDPLIMAEGLTLYSQRGEEYVEAIKKVILSNELQKYDSYSLSNHNLPEFTGPVSKATVIAESSKTSL